MSTFLNCGEEPVLCCIDISLPPHDDSGHHSEVLPATNLSHCPSDRSREFDLCYHKAVAHRAVAHYTGHNHRVFRRGDKVLTANAEEENIGYVDYEIVVVEDNWNDLGGAY